MTYNSTTTLSRIREAEPCADGWAKLLAHLGKARADDEPLDLLTILDSNGFDAALWVLSYAMPDDRLARHFQAWCAEQVLHLYEQKYPNDTRVRDQIAMLRNDDASDQERAAAKAAAWSAAWSASAWSATLAAAAWAAAWSSTWSAVKYAVGAAVGAGAAARAAQEAQLRRMLETQQ